MSDQPNAPLFNHSEGKYKGDFNTHLLEQYKVYVQSAENVSARRVASNRYMLTLSAAIVALYGVLYANFDLDWWALVIPAIGVPVSLVWYRIIKSHADLNRVKFKIIHEIEEHLPMAVYGYEWDLIGEGPKKRYRAVTKIERWVPWLFVALHVVLGVVIALENVGVLELVG